MRAIEYLEARHIPYTIFPEGQAIHGVFTAKFEVAGRPGYIAEIPEDVRITTSDLGDMFPDDKRGYIIRNMTDSLMFLAVQRWDMFIGGLPVTAERYFPTREAFGEMACLLDDAAAPSINMLEIFAELAMGHIEHADEEPDPDEDLPVWTSAVARDIVDIYGEHDLDEDTMQHLSEFMAGFRLRPETPEEHMHLMTFLASLRHTPVRESQVSPLDADLVPLLGALCEGKEHVVLGTHGIGQDLMLLHQVPKMALYNEFLATMPEVERLLTTLYPNVAIQTEPFAQRSNRTGNDADLVIASVSGEQDRESRDPLPVDRALVQAGFKRVTTQNYLEIATMVQAVNACKPGGIIAALLPATIESSSSCKELRDWIIANTTILGIVELPFVQGATGTTIDLLILTKGTFMAQEYDVTMLHTDVDDFEEDALAATLMRIVMIASTQEEA